MSSSDPEDPKTKEMLQKMVLEHDALIRGVGLVTRVWGVLENNLFQSFTVLGAFDSSTQQDAAGVIFYTPSNMETRISFVDKLVAYRFKLFGVPSIDPQIAKLWSGVKGKIDTLKSTRNAIVHGTLVSSSGRANAHDQTHRIAPNFGDVLRFLPDVMQGRHPGLGSNELRVHEKAVWRVNERLRNLNEAFQLRMEIQLGPDKDTAVLKLLELLPNLDQAADNNSDQ